MPFKLSLLHVLHSQSIVCSRVCLLSSRSAILSTFETESRSTEFVSITEVSKVDYPHTMLMTLYHNTVLLKIQHKNNNIA